MKKILLTLAILMISNVALACGGITITGKSGATYCLSKFSMNWYSAYAWCKDQGKNLIDLDTTCGTNVSACSELTLSSAEKSNITAAGGKVSYVWTNTSATSSLAFGVDLSSGNVNGNYRGNVNYFALCF